MSNLIAQDWEKNLIHTFDLNSDFSMKTVTLFDQTVKVYYLSSLVDLTSTLVTWDQVISATGEDNHSLARDLLPLEFTVDGPHQEVADSLVKGKLIAKDPDSGKPLVLDADLWPLNRSISASENENPLQSSIDGFTEKLDTNIGLIRRRISNKELVIESYILGTSSHKEIALIYMKNASNPKVVQSVKDRLSRNKHKDVIHVNGLLEVLEQPKYSLVPTYLTSELPGEAAQNLLDGKVVILMDLFPNAYSFPAIVKDLWSFKLDLNYPYLYLLFFRCIRIAGIAFAIIMPGLYVVLNSVNPELLRIQLAISVAKSREGVPYPSFVEVMLMLLLMEMVIEATIRLPKNIGPTITMVGGIILGQAIVQARLVSNLLIIILAATTISNFTMAGYLNTIGIRIFKYVVLVLSSIYGILGLQVALIWLFIYFAALKTFSVPYLSLSTKGKSPDD
ncbi:spore germination protein [Bacillus sp. FJAT-27264]|uniref:spore germination protein n=1 Tax=Paenibacillus sp. (strain DSM 101736 / FJAT-27264) TaxID=1850362 RepID=UPI000B2DDB1E|nr:spore germination protein [Bacillus sp. FJAT-27264]